MSTTSSGVQVIAGEQPAGAASILTDEALAFVADLHRTFDGERLARLAARQQRQVRLDAGERFGFLPETADVRAGDWRVGPTPADLERRWAEITGPVDRKMMITALNSGADAFMADFEDALSPSWNNVIQGQINLKDAVRGTITFEANGVTSKLNEQTATLIVRPRGWHLVERHVTVDGEPISASLFDFGMYMFHNAAERVARGTGPYFYLPKMESHLEARLWNDAFNFAQDALGIPRGTVRATVLIETLPAAFEMDEILYELREHAAALNAGRWDYIFSAIKRQRMNPNAVLPDRGQVTMTVPFMRAYTNLLVKTCHRRGAHAMGGMAAFVPNRRDADITAVALRKVEDDKTRESGDGFDGTWVAHPDLIPIARRVFDAKLNGAANQREVLREDVTVVAEQLTDLTVPGGTVTAQGIRDNIAVALQYIATWLSGAGAVAINNLMEDVATAEIARTQLWQWRHFGVTVEGGEPFTAAEYQRIRDEELGRLAPAGEPNYLRAAELLDQLVLSDTLEEFLTLRAYEDLP